MANLMGLLGIGSRALSVQSSALEVIGNNVANAATPGYHRQSLLMRSSPLVNGYGQGVFTGGVTRSYNRFTELQVLGQTSTAAGYQAEAEALYVVDGLFDETEVPGLAGAIDAFYASMHDLTLNPGDEGTRTAVLGQAQTLSRRFNDLSRGLTELRGQLDQEIQGDVAQVNRLAQDIAALNVEISKTEAGGSSAGNLRDLRDQALSDLAALTPITVDEQPNGGVTVLISGMTLVMDDKANSLETTFDPAEGTYDVVFRGSGGEEIDLTNKLGEGRIGGNVEVRDSYIDSYQRDLDALAFGFATRLNEVHEAGYGLDGTTGRSLFDIPGTQAGAAAAIAVSADVAGDPQALAAATDPSLLPGDSSNAILLYQTSEEELASFGNMTISEFYGTIAGQIGTDAKGALDQYRFEDAQLYELSVLKESQSGVNIDQEAAELQKFEAAYQAAAKYVSAISEMLDVLMRI